MMILKVKNITGTHYKADYRWELWINDELVRAGEVRNFHRAYGRGELLMLISGQVIESGDPLTHAEQNSDDSPTYRDAGIDKLEASGWKRVNDPRAAKDGDK